MNRILVRAAVGLLVVVVAGAVACSLLLPERYAVNAPLRHLLWGVPGTPPDAEAVGGLSAPGLFVEIYAEVPNARWMRLTPAGDLLVSTPRDGSIVWLGRDADQDGRPDGQRILLDGLNRPHGLELHDGWLYVGETDAVARIRFDAEAGQVQGELERIVTGLPGEGNHWTRT
ncbi:MAG: PQQ-dependent sugar dehydrogenase, partial [Myxococcota bacterium]